MKLLEKTQNNDFHHSSFARVLRALCVLCGSYGNSFS